MRSFRKEGEERWNRFGYNWKDIKDLGQGIKLFKFRLR